MKKKRRMTKDEEADENSGTNDTLMKAKAKDRLEFRQRAGFFYIVTPCLQGVSKISNYSIRGGRIIADTRYIAT